MKKFKFSVLLEEDLYQKLNNLASKERRSVSNQAAFLIEQYFNECEASKNQDDGKKDGDTLNLE